MVEATLSVLCGSSSADRPIQIWVRRVRGRWNKSQKYGSTLELSDGWWLEEIGGTFRGSVDGLEKSTGRNTEVEGDSSEVSDGNEQHAFGNWRKGNPSL